MASNDLSPDFQPRQRTTLSDILVRFIAVARSSRLADGPPCPSNLFLLEIGVHIRILSKQRSRLRLLPGRQVDFRAAKTAQRKTIRLFLAHFTITAMT